MGRIPVDFRIRLDWSLASTKFIPLWSIWLVIPESPKTMFKTNTFSSKTIFLGNFSSDRSTYRIINFVLEFETSTFKMVVSLSIGWFQIFAWKMVVSSNIHWKMVVWSSRLLCSKSVHDEHHPSCDDHFVRGARPIKQWRSLALRISAYSP